MKLNHKKRHLSDDGFSFIELIVTMLISTIVIAAVAGFMSVALRYYDRTDAETTLQTESQVTELFLTELIQESTNHKLISAGEYREGITYAIKVERESGTSVVEMKGKQLWYANVTTGDSDAGMISTLLGKGMDGAFLAKNVEEFVVTPSNRPDVLTGENGLVQINLTFNVNDKIYKEMVTVSLRNKKKN